MSDFDSIFKILSRYRMNEENDGWDGGYSVNRLWGLQRLILENLNSESVVCEIGTFTGSSTALFAYYCKKVYAVDLFSEIFNNLNYEPIFDETIKEFNNVHKIKAKSIDASLTMDDFTFDLVYIDASHLYNDVIEDIKCWKPKVKKGGILAGHDYMYEVEKAVLETLGKPDKIYEDSSWIKRID